MRIWLGLAPAVLVLVLAWRVPDARAAAEVHRLNLVLSAIPTQVRLGDYNSVLDDLARAQFEPLRRAPLDHINQTWLFDAQVRYFVRQDLAVSAGVSRLSASTSREFLPAIGQSETYTGRISSVAVHTGLAHYFTPYTQGDFQARAYVGGGFLSLVNNRASLEKTETGILTGQVFKTSATSDGPGYYAELGAHLFFATRLSVLLSVLHRSADVHDLVDEATGRPVANAAGKPIGLDVGGTGFRMALAIGL